MTKVMQVLDAACSYVVARQTDDRWHGILDQFEDASVFQTTPFVTAKTGAQGLEHFVLERDDTVIAAAQVRLIPVPLTGRSIAYILWGPLFHRRGSELDWNVLRAALGALRQEYVVKRKISLRLTPLFTREQEAECRPLFEGEGYTYVPPRRLNRTIVIDIKPPLDVLRKGLDKKWRNCLSRAEKNGLEILEGTDDSMFDLFLEIYREMLTRKRLAEPGDIRTFRAMQSLLPNRFKMRVIVVRENGEPGAGAICSAIGRRGIYLFGATSDSGMKNKASYLAQWRAIQWLQEMGCAEYDLHGINPVSNPGVYGFKTGLCGHNGKEVDFIGNFEAHEGIHGQFITRLADLANHEYKKLKNVYGKYRGFQG